MWDGFWFLANKRAWEKLPENLRARSLYEREGFAVVGTQRMGLAGHLIGVAQTLTMVKTL